MAKLKADKTFKKRPCCQVCGEDLIALQAKEYCIKKKVCPEHLQADAVSLPGLDDLHRWCHQCAKFEPLTQYEGVRRTCRERLVKRRKTPAPTRSISDAPGSPSGLHSQQPHNDTTSGYAATSPTCSTNCVAGTAFCGVFGTLEAIGTSMELQQYMQHELGCAAAAARQPEAAAGQMPHMLGMQQPLQPQQLLGFMDVPAAGSGAHTLSVADEAFDSYLDALMQHELQQCMQQVRQRQLQQQEQQRKLQQQEQQRKLQQQANAMKSAAPQLQCMGPAASQLAPGHFAPALQQPGPAYQGPAAAAAFTGGDVSRSDESCNSSAQLAADACAKHSQGIGQPMPLDPAACGADRLDACMQRGRRLQELLQRQRMLQRSASAVVGPVGALPCMDVPAFLQGSSRTVMPAHLSCSSQQATGTGAGLSRMTSTPVMASTPALLSEPAQGMHGMPVALYPGGPGLQVQQPQQQQHESALAQRMAWLQSQLADVSAQIQGLKQIVSGGQHVTGTGTAASTGTLCGVGNSFC